MERTRWQMVRELDSLFDDSTSIANGYQVRNIALSDGQLIGRLLYDAYKGTIDDEGDDINAAIAEAQETLQGRYGNVILDASFAAFAESSDDFASITLVSEYPKANPLLAYAATHPQHQKRGLSTQLIRKSLAALKAAKVERLHLVVTKENVQAVRIYQRLGFHHI